MGWSASDLVTVRAAKADGDRPAFAQISKKSNEIYIPRQPHEYRARASIIVVGLLELGGDVLTDRLIVARAAHSRPSRLVGEIDL